MERFNENAYWISIAHLPKWHTERINRLIIHILHNHKLTWSAFFELGKKDWKNLFVFSDKELTDLAFAKKDLPRTAFIAEQLDNEGYQIIPLNSADYPTLLKENLKAKNSPPVLYIKGRKSLLQEEAVAIIGSRNAGKAALDFTDHVARKSVNDLKVVVSGFAKGVDKQALDSTLEAHGKSIIVLPQGILTFQSGFKNHYASIVNGDVLVLSTFFPNAGWDVGLAMARNAYIYGLAKEIYVAETDSKGGTWEGAINGLKRQRKIYVRIPEPNEKNANQKLITLGAIPVNADGVKIDLKVKPIEDLFESNSVKYTVNDPKKSYNNDPENIENEILSLLKKDNFTSKELIMALKLDLDTRKLTYFLKHNPNIKIIGGKPVKYGLNDAINLLLF